MEILLIVQLFGEEATCQSVLELYDKQFSFHKTTVKMAN